MIVVCTRRLIGPAEAGRILDVTPERVRQLARARILQSIPLSDGRLVYAAEAVEQLAKQRTNGRRVE